MYDEEYNGSWSHKCIRLAIEDGVYDFIDKETGVSYKFEILNVDDDPKKFKALKLF